MPVRQTLAQTVQAPVFRQDSISALVTSLAGLGGKLTELPKPVAQTGRELLNTRLDLSAKPLSGDSLAQAFVRSGVLFESKLVQSPRQTLQQGDVKSLLLRLAGSLRQWRGQGAQPKHSPYQRLLPPTCSPTPRSDGLVSLALASDLPGKEVGARLLGQAEGTLARVLDADFVYAEPSARGHQPASGSYPDLNIELPMLLENWGSGISKYCEMDREEDGVWKVRFSINFTQTGEVDATVSLRRRRIGVMLWAEREETVEILEDIMPELAETLSDRGLEHASIRCGHDHPQSRARPVGDFMDNSS